MNNKMVSVDFWNTLVKADSNADKRREKRLKLLKSFAEKHDCHPTDETIREVHRKVSKTFDTEWLEKQRTMTTRELVRNMVNALDLDAETADMDDLTEAFQDSVWDGPPELAEGAEEAIKTISHYYPMSIISDTMFTPGFVLKQYLEQAGLFRYFDAFAFSDELGVSKPHPKAYHTALNTLKAIPERSWHVGDIQVTDIAGARSVGMKAILYTGISTAYKNNNTADYVCSSWEAITDILVSERK